MFEKNSGNGKLTKSSVSPWLREEGGRGGGYPFPCKIRASHPREAVYIWRRLSILVSMLL